MRVGLKSGWEMNIYTHAHFKNSIQLQMFCLKNENILKNPFLDFI